MITALWELHMKKTTTAEGVYTPSIKPFIFLSYNPQFHSPLLICARLPSMLIYLQSSIYTIIGNTKRIHVDIQWKLLYVSKVLTLLNSILFWNMVLAKIPTDYLAKMVTV